MSEEKPDYRTVLASASAQKTSLTDFLTTSTESDDGGETDSTIDTDRLVDQGSEEDSGDVATSEEQVFEVKGKQVPLKDLLNAFETREEISRRFSEVGAREKKIEAAREKARKEREELDYINEKFEEMQEQVIAGNPLAALQIAISMAPTTDGSTRTMEELVKQAIQIADNFHSMTEEEQAIFLKKEDLARKERALEKKQKKQNAQDAEQELKTFYDNFLDSNKLTDAELDAAHDDIMNNPHFRAELEKKTDPKEKISYCGSWVLGKRLNKTIEEGVARVDPVLAKDNDFRIALLDIIDPRCTIEDIELIVRNYKKTISNGSANGSSAASTQSVEPKKPTTSNRAPTEKPRAEKNNVPVRSWADILAKHG